MIEVPALARRMRGKVEIAHIVNGHDRCGADGRIGRTCAGTKSRSGHARSSRPRVEGESTGAEISECEFQNSKFRTQNAASIEIEMEEKTIGRAMSSASTQVSE